MLGRLYDNEVCSAARTLEVVGERWTLLILRDAMFAGSTRFTDFQRSLGVAPNVLTQRLNHLVEHGLFSVGTGAHREYRLTAKGLDLQPVIVALTHWGDRWVPGPQGPPVRYRHNGCNGEVVGGLRCDGCGNAVEPGELHAEVAGWAREARRSRAGSGA